MRKRNFYPSQVAKRLTGRNPETLNSAERSALRFFMMKDRKMGVGIQVAQTDLACFKSAGQEEVATIFANTNHRILMSIR